MSEIQWIDPGDVTPEIRVTADSGVTPGWLVKWDGYGMKRDYHVAAVSEPDEANEVTLTLQQVEKPRRWWKR